MHRRVIRVLIRIHAWFVHGSGHMKWQLVGLLGLALLLISSIVSAGTFSSIIVTPLLCFAIAGVHVILLGPLPPPA